jgi:transketolase C-terminal domain/subunit
MPEQENIMKTMTADEAMIEAMTEEMRRDTRVITFGEGVATKKASLKQEFGQKRVRNTPLSEGIIAGTAAGAAAAGSRPVIDLLFAPFLTLAMDGIVNSAGKETGTVCSPDGGRSAPASGGRTLHDFTISDSPCAETGPRDFGRGAPSIRATAVPRPPSRRESIPPFPRSGRLR